jgi:hypothetical protein
MPLPDLGPIYGENHRATPLLLQFFTLPRPYTSSEPKSQFTSALHPPSSGIKAVS